MPSVPGVGGCGVRPLGCLMQTPQVAKAYSNLVLQGLLFPRLMALGRREPACYLAGRAWGRTHSSPLLRKQRYCYSYFTFTDCCQTCTFLCSPLAPCVFHGHSVYLPDFQLRPDTARPPVPGGEPAVQNIPEVEEQEPLSRPGVRAFCG